MVDGLRLLQELARTGDRPVPYGEFAHPLQPGLAPIAASRVLTDIGRVCTAVGWPNLTCFVVSAKTGECSPGCRRIGDEGPVAARDRARQSYGIREDDTWSIRSPADRHSHAPAGSGDVSDGCGRVRRSRSRSQVRGRRKNRVKFTAGATVGPTARVLTGARV